jgi:alpha-ketoglutarate-dependent taurine dioxygenase
VLIHPTGHFDNHAVTTTYIEVKPLAAAMGAEVCGVDLGALTDAQFAEVEAALYRHKMIFFRQQRVDHGDHEAFSLRFGPFAEDAYTEGVPDHRNVHPLIREADDKSAMVFGSGWHTDSPFLPEPPAITTLRSVEVPPFGGDTIWADSALAYRSLSDTYRQMIDGLRTRFSMVNVLRSVQEHVEVRDSPIGRLAATRDAAELPEAIERKVRGTTHPLVRTHPVTGERALYVDQAYAIGIDGLTENEAAPLLTFLWRHVTQPAFTCRLRWEPGMVVVWDNRLCVHEAYNDYSGYRRELYRTTVQGEVPA